MTTEEDNFDIDIYGDGGGEEYGDGNNGSDKFQSPGTQHGDEEQERSNAVASGMGQDGQPVEATSGLQHEPSHATDSTTHQAQTNEEQSHPPSQGTKRKEAADDRAIDPGATGALFISELPWWITDDDIRGWANESSCEDELEDVTFSEHKVNGKSKGQVYMLFSSPQAATSTKHLLDAFAESNKYKQKFTSNYTNPLSNPFKTLPKDGNARGATQGTRSTSGSYNSSSAASPSGPISQGGFRGGRGGYNNNRGNNGGYGRGGFQQQMGGNYQGGMNNFQGNFGYGNFQGRGGGMMGGMRGGNMGMRGGRGGMNNMMGMQMGGMVNGMGNMGGQMPNMGMNMPGMGMQGNFQGANFFGQQNDNWNPHGAKRTRQE